MIELIKIGKHKVGSGRRCFIIAEAGVNHNGDSKLAHQLVDAAAQSGADAVKFQAFKAERLSSESAPKADYQLKTTNVAESQQEMLQRLELSSRCHQELLESCKKKKILFLSTPFDEERANMLEKLDIVAFKIPSGEITNLSFLEHVARKGKPLIVSTGMSTLGEVEKAVHTILKTGNQQLVLLHCVSNYPANPTDVNLKSIGTLANAFKLPVGYSDHTLGIEISLAAVAMGAVIIEKHFTLDRTLPGPDHQASLEPAELTKLVKGIRKVESAMGNGLKAPADSEKKNALVVRKSLVAANDITAGSELTEEFLVPKRPGSGLPPDMHRYLVGRRVKQDIKAGTPIKLEMLL